MRLPLVAAWFVAVVVASPGCSRATPDESPASAFDQDRAWSCLVAQVAFGPRNPGSTGHALCRDYLLKALQAYCYSATTQEFEAQVGQDALHLSNLLGTINPSGSPHVILCAHWDTRPRADQDPDPRNWNTPILGANDGASGVAVLLELARVLGTTPVPYQVSIVLFDGEDYGVAIDDYLLGSKYYAAQLPADPPTRGVLLDMVGDADLQLYQEGYSVTHAPSLVQAVWGRALSLGQTAFIPQVRHTIIDDHLPLISAGIPTIDVIDFDYPYWHTVQDTVDKCSPASLGTVGRVLLSCLKEGVL